MRAAGYGVQKRGLGQIHTFNNHQCRYRYRYMNLKTWEGIKYQRRKYRVKEHSSGQNQEPYQHLKGGEGAGSK